MEHNSRGGSRRTFVARKTFNMGPNRPANKRRDTHKTPYRGGGKPARPHFSRPPKRGRNFAGTPIHFSKYINKSFAPAEAERFVPEHAFTDFPIEDQLKRNIVRKGYLHPTPVQDKAIPAVLEGRDIVGLADTGSGKTGAFLIPILNKLMNVRHERALIMVPTRELAIQIEQELRGFAYGLGMHSVTIVGGMNIGPQLRSLRQGPQFVIGTPGRLKDVIERRALDLSRFKTVVLDEADRMLDMGFIDDMRKILSLMQKERHTLFFSATLSPDIEKLIGAFLNNPVRVSVKTRDTSQDVEQDIVRCAPGVHKIDHLASLLAQPEFKKVLIFGRTKHGVEKLSKILTKMGHPAESIHGNKTHSNRQRSLKAFKEGSAKVLVATDVAARGLDIPNVSHVINFDQPNCYDDYVHRIGRTGRAGQKGVALTFVD